MSYWSGRTGTRIGVLLIVLVYAGCRTEVSRSPSAAEPGARSPAAEKPVRLVDTFSVDAVVGRVDAGANVPERTEWRFDGPIPEPKKIAKEDETENGEEVDASATMGFRANEDVAELHIVDGKLAGKTTGEWPLFHVERTEGLDDADVLHAVEIRMRASGGANVGITFRDDEEVDLAKVAERLKESPFGAMSSPIIAGEEMKTYTVTSPFPFFSNDLRHIIVRPTDAADATFEIESIRLIFRREHLAGIPSGIGWQGLGSIYRETIVARSPEEIRMNVSLSERPWLDLSVGTIDPQPATFRVRVRAAGGESAEISRRVTVTRPHEWQRFPVDLGALAGREVEISLALEADKKGVLGFWGSPVVRANRPMGERKREELDGPRGVILIMADTLRRDHLDAYGYDRDTAPVLKRMAADGALFQDCLSQATWTKVSTPSIMTGLYPFSHGIIGYTDRLPASATTLAEVFRDAGYATLSLSSISFTGKLTSLHQGFEEVHESRSLPDRESSKTAREYVDRFLPWLEAHREVPFFVFLHVSDPHDPFEPEPPYDSLWADPSKRDLHHEQTEKVKEFIKDPLMKQFGMPKREELIEAEIDPDEYVAQARGWYDGSIRAMDAEIGRVFEALENLSLENDTLIVFTSDHGEEFLEHGRMFHGQSVYGELNQVPLIVRGPGWVEPGTMIGETVETVDIMPTILELCRLPFPEQIQGRSLAPALRGVRLAADSAGRPAFSQRVPTERSAGPPPWEGRSYAIVLDGWKLIESSMEDEAGEEKTYELYEHDTDPLDTTDLAADRPDLVEKLSARLAELLARAETEKLRPDSEIDENLSGEELERLRALGYVN